MTQNVRYCLPLKGGTKTLPPPNLSEIIIFVYCTSAIRGAVELSELAQLRGKAAKTTMGDSGHFSRYSSLAKFVGGGG